MIKPSQLPSHRLNNNDHARLCSLDTMARVPADSNLPGMDSTRVRQQVAEIADAVCTRTDEVAVHLAQTISEEVKLYQSSGPVRFDVVVAVVHQRAVDGSNICELPATAH